ncbi:hypothetical protein NDU88_007341 [Pleurodeles waltl]|uniref:Uncharacterized protein n=1 Tax=Pleurodeles waltl TaxID=8319 RepID=A0AAV7VRW0_PLEWA|nr:hypothetical protein NDU88_007341 [Pleurodeles waltl]
MPTKGPQLPELESGDRRQKREQDQTHSLVTGRNDPDPMTRHTSSKHARKSLENRAGARPPRAPNPQQKKKQGSHPQDC